MRTYLLSFLAGLLFVNGIVGQTTWTGAVDQNWHNAVNWSNGLPAPGNDALIPDVVNDPVISESTEFEFNVIIEGELQMISVIHSNQTLSIIESGILRVGDSLFLNNQTFNAGEIIYSNALFPIVTIPPTGYFENSGPISGVGSKSVKTEIT